MNKLVALLGLLVLSLNSSCDLNSFSAGSYPYAEEVYSACSGDTIIQRFLRLKATGAYTHAPSFTNGPDEPPSPYYGFYFYSRENNCFLLVVVGSGSEKKSAVLLVSVKAPDATSKWQDFNHGLDEKRQEQILAWFNKEIKPTIMRE